MYTPHNHCRACGYGKPGAQGIKNGPPERLASAYDLGIQPLANDFCKGNAERGGYAPLKVMFCPKCTLAQLSVVVKPEILYQHYSYVTSPTETMRDHFRQLFRDIGAEASSGTLLEIGSNDGALLAAFKEFGYDVLGVDPALNLVDLAHRRGVETICSLFSFQTAELITGFLQPDIILARHVFCHIDDWQDFVRGLEILCKRNTLVCLEAPHCQKTLENTEFDTIYHEHLSYLTVQSVQALLENTTLRLCRVLRYPIHGGAIMLMIRRRDSDFEPDDSVDNIANNEHCSTEAWSDFSVRSDALRKELSGFVNDAVDSGKSVAALGASAKSTVWINACGFTRKHIQFIADCTRHKWFTMSPGSDIPIYDEGALLRELPDYTIMFCWNFRDEVLVRHLPYHEKGGKFVIPIPKIEVV